MKKHILGAFIFAAIIGASVLIYSIFFMKPRVMCDFPVSQEGPISQSYSREDIKQVVFNRARNEYRIEMADNNFRKRINLNIFAVGKNGASFLGGAKAENSGKLMMGLGINREAKGDNLYVMVATKEQLNSFGYQPKFDISKAIPVLIEEENE